MTDTSTGLLTPVVIGRNEGDLLARCLDSIASIRAVVMHTTIYVDSGSRDGSPDLARAQGASVVVLDAAKPTAAMGRNAGWRRADTDFVLFLDGDTIVNPDFPRAACEILANDPSIAAVWGHRRELHPEASIYNRILDLDWIYAPGETAFCGGDVVMRREALARTGGYDEHLIAGEEPELCRRMRALGYRILHIDHPMTLHDLRITRFAQYWKRATRAGHAYAEVSDRFRSSQDPFWAAERKQNMVRAVFWLVTFALAVVLCIPFGILPLLAFVLLLIALSIRSGIKARWKGGSTAVLLLYGLHSQLQQVPIFVGQLQYELNKRSGKQQKLIEYKGS